MSMPYCNNLRKGDEVHHVPSGRRGFVNVNPRETAANVAVRFPGAPSSIYIHISELRLVENGHVAEDVPPCDGTPPAPWRPSKSTAATPAVPLDALFEKRTKLLMKLAALDEAIIRVATAAATPR
jgi:hypothetical protein